MTWNESASDAVRGVQDDFGLHVSVIVRSFVLPANLCNDRRQLPFDYLDNKQTGEK